MGYPNASPRWQITSKLEEGGWDCPACRKAGRRGLTFNMPQSRLEESLGDTTYECAVCHARFKRVTDRIRKLGEAHADIRHRSDESCAVHAARDSR